MLASCSTYFDAMFHSSFKEAQPNSTVEMTGISAHLLRKIVQYMYSGKIQICGEYVLELIEFSDMREISSLRSSCEDYLMEYVTARTAMPMWKYAKRLNLVSLADKCKRYCLKNFKLDYLHATAESIGFYGWSEELLVELLSDVDLKVHSEDTVFEALLDWFHFGNNGSMSRLREIAQRCIRMERLTPSSILRSLELYWVSDPINKAALFDILRAVSRGTITQALLPPRTATDLVDHLTVSLHNKDTVVSIPFTVESNGPCQSGEIATCSLKNSCSERLLNVFYTGPRLIAAVKFDRFCSYLTVCPDWVSCCTFDFDFEHPDKFIDLLVLPDGSLFYIHVFDKEYEFVKVLQIDKKQPQPSVGFIDVRTLGRSETLLMAEYSSYVMIFSPRQNLLHYVTTITGKYMNRWTIDFSNDQTCCVSARKNQYACLVGRRRIYIVHMDRIVRWDEPDLLLMNGTDFNNNTDANPECSPEVSSAENNQGMDMKETTSASQFVNSLTDLTNRCKNYCIDHFCVAKDALSRVGAYNWCHSDSKCKSGSDGTRPEEEVTASTNSSVQQSNSENCSFACTIDKVSNITSSRSTSVVGENHSHSRSDSDSNASRDNGSEADSDSGQSTDYDFIAVMGCGECLDSTCSSGSDPEKDVHFKSPDTKSVPADVVTRLKSPNFTKNKRIASAVVHGTRFYVAEEPTTDGKLVLHVTDFNTMVKLPNNAEPLWERQVVSIDVTKLPPGMKLTDVKLQLFDTSIPRTPYTEDL